MKKSKVIQASKFLVSVSRGDIKAISSCLKQDVNIHESVDGYQCLHYALAKNNVNTTDVVQILLQAKANINATDKKGQTPLIHAVKRDNLLISQILLNNNADISVQDLQGRDALRHAIINNASSDLVRLLINNGADINSSDSKGITPLILATQYDNDQAVELLIDRGADVSAKDHVFQSALCYAALNNNLDILKSLLRADAFRKENFLNHDRLFQLATHKGIYCLEENLEASERNFDKVANITNIMDYFIVYGNGIKVSQNIFTYLTNCHPNMMYHVSIEKPVITLAALTNILYTFLNYVEKVEEVDKSHIDVSITLYKIFKFLKPTYIPEALENLKKRLEVIGNNWHIPYDQMFKQNLSNLSQDEKGKITYNPNATFDLSTLVPHLKLELYAALKAKNVFYILDEISLLKNGLNVLNKIEAYKDAFTNLLDQLDQTAEKGDILLMQKQLTYLIPPPKAEIIGHFKLTSKIDLNKIQDPKLFFAHNEEITILESKTQFSNNAVKFTIILSLPHKESYYLHYNQICREVLDQLQSLCKIDCAIDEEVHFLPPNNRYQFPEDVTNKVLGFLSKQEYFDVAVTGKQIFPDLCSKIIEQYNELTLFKNFQQADLEEQMENLDISGDLPNYYTI
ncbi:hypothetical protein phytr_8490 [Candidatus Phycorickettsia trachydisci]|uniref:Uncharacterized protein n=1 Tax=Candidatus Phycorickettsia trachydisci TaxID=2115978 RepID=A0A2P1P943_9RICK|nr:ankyrin repeat domain-containing protein [Candidatus Phycorickettsia trachydisci]AVP87781.1 hypothetical protein phytr_8490 [Candidatus Phycorickettsia trachydisci]